MFEANLSYIVKHIEFKINLLSINLKTCMGIISKGAKCNVVDCKNDGVRSLNTSKVENAGLRVSATGKKTVLCKTHYKEWKKETKEDRSLERSRFDKFS